MDQTLLLRHLGKAESYVVRSQRRLERQRRIVADLERGGRDSGRSRYLLRLFEQIFAKYLAHRDRLRNHIGL
jgi:hypothetical protein